MCIKKLFQKEFYRSNDYSLVFSEMFFNSDWRKRWDYREPWSGENLTEKGNVIWHPDCVMQSSDGVRLIANGSVDKNHCGLISSHKFLNFKFGCLYVTAKMPPKGFTYFPAIWLYDRRGWLPEIDVVELMGKNSRYATFTHHWSDELDIHRSKGKGVKLPFDLSAGLHVFGIEWTPEKITWFIDNVVYFEVTKNIPKVPLFLICNIQSGGDPPFTRLFNQDEYPEFMTISSISLFQKP